MVHRLQAVPQNVRARCRRYRHVRVAFPYVRLVVARRHRRLTVESRIHNQRQLIHAVAAAHRLLSVVVLARRRAALAVPLVRKLVLAQLHRFLRIVGRVHRQRQLEHAVALVHRLQAVPQDIRARCRRYRHVRVAFPYVRLVVARAGRHLRVIGRMHRQRQFIDTVALVHRLQAVPHDVRARGRRDRHVRVAFPHVRLVGTRLAGILVVVGRVHRQGQLIHAVAVVHRLQAVPHDMRARRRRNRHVRVTRPYVRLVIACRGRSLIVVGRVHRQGQLIHAVAMVHRLQAVPNRVKASRRRNRHIGMTFPNIRFIITSHSLFRNKIGRVHRQRQLIDAVATGGGFQAVPQDIRTRRRRDGHIPVAFPHVRDIVARCSRHLFIECRVHHQCQHINAVAMVYRFQTIPNRVESSRCRNRHVSVAFPNVRLVITSHSLFRNKIGRVHRQRQFIDAVAVVHRLQAVPQKIRSGRGRNRHIGMAFPNVRLIVTRGSNRFEEIGRIQLNSQVDHAVALVLAGEHHQIGAFSGEQAVTILQRQFCRAHILDIGRGRVRLHNERDNDRAVASVHRRVMKGVVTRLVQHHISIIDIRKFVRTSIDRIIMLVGGIHIQRQSGDNITTISKCLHHIIHTSLREQGILIRERQFVVADGHLIGMALKRNHNECHIDNTVTTMGRIEMNGALGISCKLDRIVEDIRQCTLARFYLYVVNIYGMNGQVEGHDAVAAVLGVQLSHIISRLIIHVIIESDHIALTNLLIHILMIGRVHRQHQFGHAVATGGGLQAVPNHVLARRRRDRHIQVTVPDIGHIVARNGRHLAIVRRIHRQGQLIYAVATGNGLQRIVIDTSGLIRTPAPLVRQFVTANDILHRNQVGRVHRQGQLINAVTTVHRMQAVPQNIRSSRGRYRHAGMPFPNVRSIVTRGGRCFLIIGRIHRKVQVHETIAPVNCGQHDRINACSSIFNIVISIDITLANRHIHIVTVSRVHRQGQHAHTVAALRGLQMANHRMRTHCRRQRIKTIQLIRLAQTDGVNN